MAKCNDGQSDAVATGNVPNYSSTTDTELETAAANSGDGQATHSLTRREIVGLVCTFTMAYAATSIVALWGPLYPILATTKRLSPAVTGIVLGIYSLVGIFVPPLAGILLKLTSIVFIMKSGCLIAGLGGILLGFLRWSPPDLTFLILSVAVFFTTGVGITLSATIYSVYVATTFPSRLATINGGVVVVLAIASSITPIIGGHVNEVGGFFAPNAMFGGFMLLTGLMVLCLFQENESTIVKKDDERQVGVFGPLKHVGVCIQLMLVLLCNLIIGVNASTLTYHLQEVSPGIDSSTVGYIFFAYSGAMAVSSMVTGVLMDRIKRVYLPLFVGLILIGVGCAYLGPMWPIDVRLSLVSVAIAEIVSGIGCGIAGVGGYYLSFVELYSTGCPNNKRTNAVASGLASSVIYLGNATGSILGGYLYDYFGYGKMVSSVVAMTVIIFAVTLIFTLRRQSLSVRARTEKAPETR